MSEAVEETPVVLEEDVESSDVSDDLSADELKQIVAKLRKENASKRIMNKAKDKELADAAAKWQEYEESQKSEFQKLQERNAELEARLESEGRDKLRMKLASEFKLDSDLAEFIDGKDEGEMRSKAEKLAKRINPLMGSDDLRAGDRGAPVGSRKKTGGQFLEGLLD
jgi:hypothetical protein